MSKQRVLVTGASGFVGSAVVKRLLAQSDSYEVVAVARTARADDGPGFRSVSGLELLNCEGWAAALHGVDVVVHCAARAHVMKDQSLDPLAEYRRVNVDGALNLASEASKAGVKRFVFISTVKVHGEDTNRRAPFCEADKPVPEDAYARSKHEAELKLKAFCEQAGMELVVVRPPLVYGPGVKGNFASLLKLCNLPIPLPFGSMKNKRSMVYVGNLADFLVQCVSLPAAAREVFLVSDDETLSLTELLAELRRAQGRSPWLVIVPVFLFRFAAVLLGKSSSIERLTGELRIDSTKARHVLGWSAPYSVKEGLKLTVDDYNCPGESGDLV
ncbi:MULTISPECIES: UDP-glucose 4-epimerase family protein [Marinobacter]|uniref:UDP-glucose 4-epimerase family protein n=1 Tax=Marinobacter shengliensis TaxID=1389223 RepID=A0ABV4W710_9GAMM